MLAFPGAFTLSSRLPSSQYFPRVSTSGGHISRQAFYCLQIPAVDHILAEIDFSFCPVLQRFNSLQQILVLIHAMFYSIPMAFLKKLLSVEMLLRDMLYVSYLIPSSRIIRFLPPFLKPAVVDGERVFVTLVIFRGKTSGAATIPTPHPF